MSELQLFDTDNQPTESYGMRLTIWRGQQLERGIHPITGCPLREEGGTCGTCAHHVVQQMTAGTYHKCDLNLTRGPKTDLRVRWPACTRWEPADG